MTGKRTRAWLVEAPTSGGKLRHFVVDVAHSYQALEAAGLNDGLSRREVDSTNRASKLLRVEQEGGTSIDRTSEPTPQRPWRLIEIKRSEMCLPIGSIGKACIAALTSLQQMHDYRDAEKAAVTARKPKKEKTVTDRRNYAWLVVIRTGSADKADRYITVDITSPAEALKQVGFVPADDDDDQEAYVDDCDRPHGNIGTVIQTDDNQYGTCTSEPDPDRPWTLYLIPKKLLKVSLEELQDGNNRARLNGFTSLDGLADWVKRTEGSPDQLRVVKTWAETQIRHLNAQHSSTHTPPTPKPREVPPMASNPRSITSQIVSRAASNAGQGLVIASCNTSVNIVTEALADAIDESTNPMIAGPLKKIITSKFGKIGVGLATGIALPFLAPRLPEGRARDLCLNAADVMQQQSFSLGYEAVFEKVGRPLLNHFIEVAKSLPADWEPAPAEPVALGGGVKVNTKASTRATTRSRG